MEVLVYTYQYRKGAVALPSSPIKARGDVIPPKLHAELSEAVERFTVCLERMITPQYTSTQH